MATTHRENDPSLYRLLPSLDEVMTLPSCVLLARRYSREMVIQALRSWFADLRRAIAAGEHTHSSLLHVLDETAGRVEGMLQASIRPSLIPVLNATGVLLHTNLGRAPLSRHALERMAEISQGYSNLEFDLETGQRGQRDRHAGPLLLRLLALRAGQSFENVSADYDVAIVNNCAAATFLSLHSLAEGGEVIVSRGELVEIGGSFRVPDILRKSGALLREVGTTNKTRVADYQAAMSANTRLVLRVHQSNFRMEGFTERPCLADLVTVCRAGGIPLFEDQGTGSLLDSDEFGFARESSLVESFRCGTDLICASGDKLLGGPQCGILVGKRHLIAEVRRNPLFRIFRVDKTIYAALEATVLDYLVNGEESIPLLRMLRMPAEALRIRCEKLIENTGNVGFECRTVPTESVVGGGTTPGATLPSFAVGLRCRAAGASALLGSLRRQSPPLVGRIQDEEVLLDLRTVGEEQDVVISQILRAASHELEQ